MNLTATEIEFMNLIWKYAPLRSTELVKLANEQFGWKKSTTYTVIKHLVDKRAIESKDAVVSPIVLREDIAISVSKSNFDSVYGGSVGLFLTSFLNKEKLTSEEAKNLKKIIDQNTKSEG